MAGPTMSLDDVRALVSQEIGVSDWTLVDQRVIDAFAHCTGDFQFIHVDTARAAQTPFGGTIAHGFLTLSLLSAMAQEVLPTIAGTSMVMNFGFNRVRFLSPVPEGSRIRARFVLTEIVERKPGQWQQTLSAAVEIEGSERPALAAEWLALVMIEPETAQPA